MSDPKIEVKFEVSLSKLVREMETIDKMDTIYKAPIQGLVNAYNPKGPYKISQIKAVRERTGANLKSAKVFVEAVYEFRMAESVTERIDLYGVMVYVFEQLANRE